MVRELSQKEVDNLPASFVDAARSEQVLPHSWRSVGEATHTTSQGAVAALKAQPIPDGEDNN